MSFVCLGEMLLRLSPEPGQRLSKASQFQVVYGGGEANVAISLANYGQEVEMATILPSNPLGLGAKAHLQSFGVGTKDLVFQGDRMGIYYLEPGSSQKGASVVYDRAYSSFAMTQDLPWDLDQVFAGQGIFHMSGIVPALSSQWLALSEQLLKEAKSRGWKVSFDINYRGKLWSQGQAGQALKVLLPYVDILSAGPMDAAYLLGLGDLADFEDLDHCFATIQAAYPNLQVLYATKRTVESSNKNHLTGYLWTGGQLYASKTHVIEPIIDRVGGGDAYAGGILHGLASEWEPQAVVDFATGASVLKHALFGDANDFSQEEVTSFLKQESGKISR